MKRIRLAGHPLHPLTVHVPFGLLAVVPILDGAAVLDVSWAGDTAWWALALGLAAAVVAATAGLLDYLSLPKGHPASSMADLHMGLMGSAVSAYAVSLALRSTGSPGLGVAAGALGLVLLLAGGWTGGEMVYGHGVGTRDKDTAP